MTEQTRPLHKIADDIMRKWRNPANSAIPYINAMTYLNKITDSYVNDPADQVVLYFLNNAKGWRGDDARRVKAELRAMLAH